MANPRNYTANVPLPSKLNTEDRNLAQIWKKNRRQFENYCIASRLDKEEDAFQCAVFLATVGEDAMDIFDGLHFDAEADKKKLDKVIKAFEDFCVGETHEAYESYKFHIRRQKPEETIEAFITSLRQLAKPCNFAQLEDRLIRDQVVVGVREENLRERLLEEKNLTLATCLEIGRAYETSWQQSQSISTGQDASGIQVNRLSNPKYKKGRKSTQGKGDSKNSECSRCGKSPHDMKDCPAKDAKCRKCQKKGHWAVMCRSKKIGHVRHEQDSEFVLGSVTEETSSIGAVEKTPPSNIEAVEKKNDLWHARKDGS